jgi:hypothetical protein
MKGLFLFRFHALNHYRLGGHLKDRTFVSAAQREMSGYKGKWSIMDACAASFLLIAAEMCIDESTRRSTTGVCLNVVGRGHAEFVWTCREIPQAVDASTNSLS